MQIPNQSSNPLFIDEEIKAKNRSIVDSAALESKETKTTRENKTNSNYAEEYPSLVAKNVYLNLLNPPQDILYVNQIIPIEMKLLIFSDYSNITTNFILENESIEVLNPNEKWILNQDSSLKNTFYFKIKQPSYTIPKIEVVVKTNEGEAKESTQAIEGKAIVLERKGVYSQVVAQDLQILDTKITSYDSQNNLVVLQIQGNMANLFDFHLAAYSQQGIESKSGDYKESVIFYYVIVPKSLEVLSFDYFNIQSKKYVELQVENLSQDDRISTQSDIKPKNTLQIYKILAAIFLAIVFFGLYFYKRKIIFLILGICVLAVLFYLLSIKTAVSLKPNAEIRIQPTFNSTIILKTKDVIEVKILADRHGYYKVLLEDERIGWVKEDDIQN
ncbi:SH3 domain-containing protein [Helicobacter pullorum NCTC 12824]|nr:SH3 domain-containing protein [Helicobacter pullorum NCTC 12824]